ncbi:MAG: response regulator transcription factor [Candidatus Methylomirabilis sp.]|nr:response regulator transcription factor [Candidatus Methylomirabilis sp.]
MTLHPEPVPVSEGGLHAIRVLLADDHPVVRSGLVALLHDYPDIEVIGEAIDGVMALNMARQLKPDVVLMDVTMPRMNGIDATRLIVSELPNVRVIGLSMHGNEQMAASMRRAGAVAYLHKGGSPDALVAAIHDAVAQAAPSP